MKRVICCLLCCLVFIVLVSITYYWVYDNSQISAIDSNDNLSESLYFSGYDESLTESHYSDSNEEHRATNGFHDLVTDYLEQGYEIAFDGLIGRLSDSSESFFDGDFVLSAPPGFHDEPFDLVVSIPSMPEAVIYFTIDGNEPQPGKDRYVIRGNKIIQVSGKLREDGKIGVHDRSGYWRESILTYHSDSWIRSRSIMPARDAKILQGSAFRFRGYDNGNPVTETITVTYIVAPRVGERFNNIPVIAITAPYNEFIHIYSEIWSRSRRIFIFEYYEYDYRSYSRIFRLPGSTSLGGNYTRDFAQRTFNVHLSRNQLDGVVTHPIFAGLYELYRFRLWNGGDNFIRDFMRDPFAQTASSELNVQQSEKKLAIKFINGEYWGFTTIREHNSNEDFISTRLGLDYDNIVIIDLITGVLAGDKYIAQALRDELDSFIRNNDLSEGYAKRRFFDEYFCKLNFMDYLIANTFFNNEDWPFFNVRFFRAINPVQNSQNPYEDGKWRFLFHDMDQTGLHYNLNRFSFLYELKRDVPWGSRENYMFQMFNNLDFVKEFVERAIYVLENEFTTENLLKLHTHFVQQYEPLMPEMFNRFEIRNMAIARFNSYTEQLRYFLLNREFYYRKELEHLIERLK